jgi:hypothetical protein
MRVKTSTDSSGGSELNARSNKARMFLSSFKRDKKSAYLQHSGEILAFGGTILADKTIMNIYLSASISAFFHNRT